MPEIRILIVDHHALVRSALRALLNTYAGFDATGEANSGEEMLQLLNQQHFEVILLDIEIPGSRPGLEWLAAARTKCLETRVVVLTNQVDPASVQGALRSGAISYLLKNISADELAQAVRMAMQGVPVLSPEVTKLLIEHASAPAPAIGRLTTREQQILQLMTRGWNNHRIAAELSISLSTVQFHVSNILGKLHVRNRTEAAMLAVRHELNKPEGAAAIPTRL